MSDTTARLTPPARVTLQEFDEIFQAVKNWGRWGDDDELGTLNYITPDFVHVFADGKIVKSGGKELALELEDKGYAGMELAHAG